MPFFIRNGSQKKGANKRKKVKGVQASKSDKAKKKKLDVEVKDDGGEDIPSSDSDGEDFSRKNEEVESEDESETEQEKKLRLAKKYLAQAELEAKERAEAEEIDRSAILHRLKDDVLEQKGQLQRKLAATIKGYESEGIRVLRGHKAPVTCIILSPDDKFIFSGAKDSALMKWCFKTGQKLKVIHGCKKGTEKDSVGHSGHIQALAISSDGKYLASGCTNRAISVWNPETMERLHVFEGHRDAVTGLVFRFGSHQLFSCSADRSVKVWNVDEMAYVETLFGHQDGITSIDSFVRERAITSGGRDQTVRLWKIVEESQLVYQSHACCVDNVKMINEQHFVSCGDDGSISLWIGLKKKPSATVFKAHGELTNLGECYWIAALAALKSADLIASGSWNGELKLWACGEEYKSLKELFSIPVKGFVNSLQFSSTGNTVVAAVGQEHRLGRWWRIKEAKNSVVIIPLKVTS